MRFRDRGSGAGVAAGALVLVLAPVLAGCGLPAATAVDPPAATPTATPTATTTTTAPAPSASPPAAGTPAPGTAAATLAALPVKGRAPRTGYSRERFGDGWVDVDRNGCGTRDDVLARDLTATTFEAGTRDCVVRTGTLADPYSGTTIAFTRGRDTSAAVQVDHVVALSDAWQKGAQRWDPARRTAFANDPLELLAVDGRLNAQKGDGDAATWLPPDRGHRCAYVARQIAVKATWGLWVTPAERDAMTRVLAACPGEPLPAAGATRAPAPAADPAADPAAAPVDPPAPAPGGTDPDLGTCRAARAAGLGPYVAGRDPEYAFYRDADHDGTVCE